MKRIIAAVIATLALLLAVAIPANAATGRCWVGGDSNAYLAVSKYPLNNGTWFHQEYHIDMNSTGKYSQYRLYFDGVQQSSTNERYVDTKDTGTHTIKGTWLYVQLGEYFSTSCTVVV